MPILTSQWGNLDPSLIATLYPVERIPPGEGGSNAFAWQRAASPAGDVEVRFPIADGNLEAAMNWMSPFEGIGAENKAPILAALLQSGAAKSATSALFAILPDEMNSVVAKLNQDLTKGETELEGRTSITKLNSTQIFGGMQPLKLPITALFRAWSDVASEVTAPVNQLWQWSLPQKLSAAGFIANATAGTGIIRALFPSTIPQILGFEYGGPNGIQIIPVVIESISQPLVGPRDKDGARINVSVSMSIATLAAIDKNDFQGFKFK